MRMDDRDDLMEDAEADREGSMEADELNDDEEAENDADDGDNDRDEDEEDDDVEMEDGDGENDDGERDEDDTYGERDGEREGSTQFNSASDTVKQPVRPLPKVRPEAVTASSYDIVPYVAAPQSTSINAFCSTPCMKWIFTGGSDGYIRKYDWFASINGKLPLTVAQRHPFVDSVTRAGVLMSYWENEEPGDRNSVLQVPETTDDFKTSAVYSLAVHNQALWLLSGLDSGGINLQTVRHQEGTIITTLRNHSAAVSVLTLAADEKSVLSGSWDRAITDWDLNVGKAKLTYTTSAGQIASIAYRPDTSTTVDLNSVFYGNPNDSQFYINGGSLESQENGTANNDSAPSPAGSFGSLFGDDDEASSNNDATLTGDAPRPQSPNLFGEYDGESALYGSTQQTNGTSTVDPTQITNTQPTSLSSNSRPSANSSLNNSSTTANTTSFRTTITHSPPPQLPPSTSQTTILASSIDGTLRLFDLRAKNPITTIYPKQGVPPWCTSSVWSTTGNHIYVGRRNGTVEEYDIHSLGRGPSKTMKFPQGSGPVTGLWAMPNGRHLICASFDNLRLQDLTWDPDSVTGVGGRKKEAGVGFLIVPGHHGGVVSSLWCDPSCRFMVSCAGTRGWDGSTTECFLGYEVNCIV
ncbi:WD40 repeat-like protein [Ascobolus immersus RN42]|uniref:WD40 repeat-like protein n=1 Tax=Ascobolus immersus RN42 TaxID=1160509 RepID=A0A3N4IB46_ASCIM|nr:WD40 repeat-like protein [Ascobolus immersus RN42]